MPKRSAEQAELCDFSTQKIYSCQDDIITTTTNNTTNYNIPENKFSVYQQQPTNADTGGATTTQPSVFSENWNLATGQMVRVYETDFDSFKTLPVVVTTFSDTAPFF